MAESREQLEAQYEQYVQRALDIVSTAEQRGVQLRVLGAISVLIHCPQHRHMLVQMTRALTDIDFVGLAKQEKQIEATFDDMGYLTKGGGVTMEMWAGRRMFTPKDPASGPSVDVFFDNLDFCHKVDFTKRIQLDSPTITMTDLLLEKLQIVEINEKDLKDIIIVLLEHEVNDKDDRERVNGQYIASRFAAEWGFYYTASLNFEKAKAFIERYDALSDEDRGVVRSRIDQIWKMVEAHAKPLAWRTRARVGPRVKWYKDVAEEYRDLGV